jgi:regulator of protease activity HflC (stomatin/prohibitin superfamily)
VQQGERLVVRRDAQVLAVLGPGRHRLPGRAWRRRLERVDVRERLLLVSGQEVTTADAPGVKVSLVVRWHVADPVAWLDVSAEPVEQLRVQAQLALRDWAVTRGVDEVVAERGAATELLTAAVAEVVRRTGVAVESVAVRDVVVPGELRRAALAVATARAEGLADLERARAESAALRSRANGARLLSDHPALLHLRAIETAAERGGTIVLQQPGTEPRPR